MCNIEDYPDEKWEDMMAITVTAPFRFIKHFIPAMKNRGTLYMYIYDSVFCK